MEMSGEQIIQAAQAEVWRGLNDPAMLKACISGCESIRMLSDPEEAGGAPDAASRRPRGQSP